MDLLRAKFYMPPPRPNLVPRAGLLARLDEGLDHGRPLALISAPAGYGKTTLAAAWLTAGPAPRCAWLALDEQDNDPAQFFAYFAAALHAAGAAAPAPTWPPDPLPPPHQLAAALLTQLGAEDDRPLLLVLDDYHKIQTAVIHDTLQFWLEHAPPFAQLVLVTREDPPLPLARWRAQARLTEIRAGDLQFSLAEAAAFLNQTMNLGLTPAEVAALEQRTEGWIAGLQLAAVALRYAQSSGTTGSAAFIAEFSGSHHYVIDYLVEEVLRRQPEHIREFLQQTAVLDRLCASLAAALTGRDDSQAILTALERANLFLIPLDNQQRWYRYHHLLADSLRAGLDPPRAAALHVRAADWFVRNGHPAPAMRHALASGSIELAADTLDIAIRDTAAWSRGDVGRLTAWLEALPEPLLRARPTLSLHASRAFYLAGELDRAVQLLAQAEEGLAANPAASTANLRALAAVYRGAIAAQRGADLDETIQAMSALLSAAAPVERHTLARAADTLGLAHELRGDLPAAQRAYLQAAELAAAAGVNYLAINARGEVALVQIQAGRLDQAELTCRQALEASDNIPPAGLIWAILGEIARERDELEAAKTHLERGIRLSQEGGIREDLRHAYLFQARLRLAQGDPAAALDAWEQAGAILQGYRVPRLNDLAAALRVPFDLAAGDRAAAAAWAAAIRPAATPYLRETEELALARVRLAQGDFDAAAASLAGTLAAARENGRGRAAIEALILLALAHEAQGQPAAASAALERALRLAAPQGFARLFLEAPDVAAPLSRARSAAPAFAGRLLDRLAARAATTTGVLPAVSPPRPAEPLSEREQEVLALLVAGHSNDDIAAALFITTGTAKWHVHNIYQKLDVGSRAQAIARAHEWRLV